jgi:hypothetical protein
MTGRLEWLLRERQSNYMVDDGNPQARLPWQRPIGIQSNEARMQSGTTDDFNYFACL